MIAQFGPYNWVQFEWKPLSSLGRWCATLGIMFIVRNSYTDIKPQLCTIVIIFFKHSFAVPVDWAKHFLSQGMIKSVYIYEPIRNMFCICPVCPMGSARPLAQLGQIVSGSSLGSCRASRNFSIFWRSVCLEVLHSNPFLLNIQLIMNRDCENFGRQSWVILAIVITEFLIVARFDWETITKPLPR